jgi:hypothetical protein
MKKKFSETYGKNNVIIHSMLSMRRSTTTHYEDTGGYISAKVLTKGAFYLQKSKGYISLFSDASHRKPRMSQHIHIFVTLSMTVDEEKLSRRWNLKAYVIFIMLLYFQMLQRLLSSVAVHD